ncbi:MAG: polysaccharide deacetylase family protein [candidate division KSB1 bacterium]|nr:polysaccharide deacetylase family protein [candidate division KSB1 bacterium]
MKKFLNLYMLAILPMLTAVVLMGVLVNGQPSWIAWTSLAAGALCWLGILTYAAFYPPSQLFGRVIAVGDHSERLIALTFDDGPCAPYSSLLLEVLKKFEVRATFFVVGKNVEKYPAIVQQMVSQGHAVGNHTYSHVSLINCGLEELTVQLTKTQEILKRVTGYPATIFRPPYGLRDPRVISMAHALGLQVIQWGISSWDWRCPGAQQIADHVLRRARPGAIVLLHDGAENTSKPDRRQTIEAVALLIPQLRNLGYRFATVPELVTNSRMEQLVTSYPR